MEASKYPSTRKNKNEALSRVLEIEIEQCKHNKAKRLKHQSIEASIEAKTQTRQTTTARMKINNLNVFFLEIERQETRYKELFSNTNLYIGPYSRLSRYRDYLHTVFLVQNRPC